MSASQASKEPLTRLHERLFRDADYSAIGELLSTDFAWRQAALPEDPEPGRSGLLDFARMIHSAFPDLTWDIEPAWGSGDRAALRWTLRGTHSGPLWGRPGTNHPILVTGIHIARVEDGRICELWQNWGLMGLLQQVGFLPIIGEQTVFPVWDYPEPGSVRAQ